jgi:uncharacterized membrane protein YqiK
MSNTPTVVEINCETGEVTERPFTEAELAQREVEIAKFAEIKAAEEAAEAVKAAAKASAEAKLASLGLTTDEIAALTK